MINFILFSFAVAMYCGGFWCGAKFGTYSAMKQALRDKFKSML